MRGVLRPMLQWSTQFKERKTRGSAQTIER
jgi:hypothetical protein